MSSQYFVFLYWDAKKTCNFIKVFYRRSSTDDLRNCKYERNEVITDFESSSVYILRYGEKRRESMAYEAILQKVPPKRNFCIDSIFFFEL